MVGKKVKKKLQVIMIKYDIEEDVWWLEKKEMLKKFVSVLVKIFRKTLGPEKRIFNIPLLIRQNFLSLCETPECMIFLFGQPYVDWKDEEGDYIWASRLEDEVVEKVMKELGVENIELEELLS